MRRYLGIACVAFLFAYALMSAGTGQSAAARTRDPVRAASPITHVVIIYQENHTFDNVLGDVCRTRKTPCNGYIGPVTFADGVQARNIIQPDIVPDIAHEPYSQQLGLANQWDRIRDCRDAPFFCISHVKASSIPNLAALARTFAVSDASFASGDTESFGAHITLSSGTIDGFVGYNPVTSKTGQQPRPGWGCPSNKDALWGEVGHQVYVPSCIPDKDGTGPYRESPVPYAATIMERMEEAGLNWHIYQGEPAQTPINDQWSICTYFTWCYRNRFDLAHDSSTDDFVAAANAGQLPNLSLILPTWDFSQHNDSSMTVGDNYIGELVSAAEHGPQWNSTAIFITYDDCGCFYDHVKPPAGMGLRDPMVIVSPWAKPVYTDSTTAVMPYSMLAFVQHNFNLRSLTTEVDQAYDYAKSFDYGQRPLVGPTMTTRSIPHWEQVKLRQLSSTEEAEEDPT